VSVTDRISFELAVSALSQQERTLVELRARTGTLIAAAALVASFLGAEAIDRSGIDGWVSLALLAFAVSIVLSVYVLLPRDRLVFALDAPEAYQALNDVRTDEGEAYRRLSYWVHGFRAGNHRTLRRLDHVFGIASASLVLEVGFLAASLVLG
jgi:hypothetical protein